MNVMWQRKGRNSSKVLLNVLEKIVTEKLEEHSLLMKAGSSMEKENTLHEFCAS